ncbi:thermonuclease family protein [Xylophilus sp. GOD-11R]|uniref:thermonuclease family protein n=1 Tax=Xylophilus sp. GOD-11R TaxID=3089814 RepID=UPI00298CDFFF|nr:thermonuclease family protein [Xylophilus sp. GOD-11R]WPB58658.1 thermonuclease family protein [Xylophilus sp. GOD-11R]
MIGAILLCLVVGIADGDTLTARCGEPGAYQQVKVRIAAIDAPERRQPFGEVSRQYLADLCNLQEAEIRVRSKDRYGRTVADVKCRDQDAAENQVRAGMAWYYTRYGQGYGGLAIVEQEARRVRAGLWADRDPVPPWQWRRTK